MSPEKSLRDRLVSRREVACVGTIALSYLLVGLVLPIGPNVPLGDSWTFAWSARELAEHGRLVLSEGQSMTLVAQLLLAAPVGLLFAATPSVLNLFNFCLSGVTTVLFFLSFRALDLPRTSALLAAGTLAANPIWLAQSVSFDTETSFLFFSALGLVALLVWDRGGPRAAIWLSGTAFAAAVLVRQHGIVYALAGFLYAAWSRPRRSTVLAAFLLPVAALVGFYAWLHLVHGVPKAFVWSQKILAVRLSHPAGLAIASAVGLVAAAHYYGLFLIPLLPLAGSLGTLVPTRGPRARATAGLLVLLALGTVLAGFGFGMVMPSLPNVVTLEAASAPFGIDGPMVGLRIGLTAIAVATGAWALLAGLAHSFQGNGASTAARHFVAACAALLLAFSLLTGLFFDRYLLLPLPFLVPLVLPRRVPRRLGVVASTGLLAVVLGFSIFYVDQRIRSSACEWEVAQALLRETQDPHRIDGGVAFNGYYSYRWLSKAYGAAQQDPWPPWVQPSADLVVRPFALDDPRVKEIDRHRCPNHARLEPFQVFVYRRTIFSGPPLRTPQG